MTDEERAEGRVSPYLPAHVLTVPARNEFAHGEPRPVRHSPDALPVLLPRPRAGVVQPYRNLASFADRFGYIYRATCVDLEPRQDAIIEKRCVPQDPFPRKDLNGGYLRQPNWLKRAFARDGNDIHIIEPLRKRSQSRDGFELSKSAGLNAPKISTRVRT
jgi:hypothetical protein